MPVTKLTSYSSFAMVVFDDQCDGEASREVCLPFSDVSGHLLAQGSSLIVDVQSGAA